MSINTSFSILWLLISLVAADHHSHDGHTHDDGHGHDKDVHSHDIAHTDHCFSCDHQVYSVTGSASKPLALDHFKSLTGRNEDCKMPGVKTPSVHCSLGKNQVCAFQLVDVNIKSKDDHSETYSVRLVSRRCINGTQPDKSNECITTDRDMHPWVGISLKNLTNSGYEVKKSPRICYCNTTSDCNGEVVSAAALVSIQGVNIWCLASLALGYLFLRSVYLVS